MVLAGYRIINFYEKQFLFRKTTQVYINVGIFLEYTDHKKVYLAVEFIKLMLAVKNCYVSLTKVPNIVFCFVNSQKRW